MSNELIGFLAGAIASPIFQVIKAKYNWSGDKAYWLAFGFSLLAAAGGIALAGEFVFSGPEDLLGVLSTVFLGAQAAFKLVVRPVSEQFA